jgi:hypothetical protein
MKVYVLTQICEDPYYNDVLSNMIFTTNEKAQIYLKEHPGYTGIVEITVQ